MAKKTRYISRNIYHMPMTLNYSHEQLLICNVQEYVRADYCYGNNLEKPNGNEPP